MTKSKTDGLVLGIDIGNTNTVIGLFEGTKLVRHWRMQTEDDKTADEYGILLWSMFQAAGMPHPRVSGAVACTANGRMSGRATGAVAPP